MPLAISVIKKYFPSLSNVRSSSSSHCGLGVILKPLGGGPWGVAYVLLLLAASATAGRTREDVVIGAKVVATRASCRAVVVVESIMAVFLEVAVASSCETLVVSIQLGSGGMGRQKAVGSGWRVLLAAKLRLTLIWSLT